MLSSITEVEVIVGVVVVFALAEARANEVEGDGEPGDAEPHAQAVVNNHTVEEETFEPAEQKVEEPLLRGVRTVMPDVATSVRTLLVKVFLSIPGPVLELGHAETLTVGQAHVLHVSKIVMGQATSYIQAKQMIFSVAQPANAHLPFTSIIISFIYYKQHF